MGDTTKLIKTSTLFVALLVCSVATGDLVDDVEEAEATPDLSLKNEKKPIEQSKKNKNETNPKSKTPKKKNKDAPIDFKGKKLTVQTDSGVLLLEKEVQVFHDGMTIDSDQAEIFYDKSGDTVTQIVATGDVKFLAFDENTNQPIKASGQKVVYNKEKDSVSLTGNAILDRGKDKITAKVIEYNLATGMVYTGGGVEGVVNPSRE